MPGIATQWVVGVVGVCVCGSHCVAHPLLFTTVFLQATRLLPPPPKPAPQQQHTDGLVFLAERESRRLREKLQQEKELTQWLEQEVRDVRVRGAETARELETAELARDRVSRQLADATRQLAAAAEQMKQHTAAAAAAAAAAADKLDDVETRLQCIACCTAARSYLPSCGHLSMCHACAARVLPQACPICKKKYRTGRTVFLS